MKNDNFDVFSQFLIFGNIYFSNQISAGYGPQRNFCPHIYIYIYIYVSYIYETYFFKISRTSAFRKVYMLWGYLLPLKSYSTLKSCSERGGHFLFSHPCFLRFPAMYAPVRVLRPCNCILRII